MVEGTRKGWRRVKFGDVVRLCTERVDPKAAGIQRYVGLEHLEGEDLRIRRWGDVAEGTTFTNRFKPGQVLFGKRRAYQRKLAVADFEGVCSGDIYVLESSSDGLLAELLPFICQSDGFFEHALKTSAGSLSPRTNWASLREYEFALPPRQEQLVFVARLSASAAVADAVLNTLDAAVQARRAYCGGFSSLLTSGNAIKDSAVGTIPASWDVRAVEELGEVQLGQKLEPSVHAGSNLVSYLRVANVYDGSIDISDVLEMHFSGRDHERYRLRRGDILLNEGQSLELVGRCAIWQDELPDCCFQMTLLRFRPGPAILPEFAKLVFRSFLYRGEFARVAVQTTAMAHLTAARFSKMLMPVPSMEEQRHASSAMIRLDETIEALRLRRKHHAHLHRALIDEAEGVRRRHS